MDYDGKKFVYIYKYTVKYEVSNTTNTRAKFTYKTFFYLQEKVNLYLQCLPETAKESLH